MGRSRPFPPGAGSFVPARLATVHGPDPPDEKSPKEKVVAVRGVGGSCFRPAAAASPRKTQEHNHGPNHRLGTRAPITEGGRKAGAPLEDHHWLTSSPTRRHPSSSSPSSSGDCATGLCSHLMNDLPKNTVCAGASRWKNLAPT